MAPARGNGKGTSSRRRRLGQLLLDRGWISGEQLIRAVQSQRAVGGRIGTCLLEMDAVSEDRLLDALAGQLGVPPIRIDQLRTIGQEVLRLVPASLAVRYRAVPFEITTSEVRIAALDVEDLAQLDEIAFCAGKKVMPHIANEARLFEALERYYSIECPQRYGHLLDRLNRVRYLWKTAEEDATSSSELEDDPHARPSVRWVRPDEAFGPLAELQPPMLDNIDHALVDASPDVLAETSGPTVAALDPDEPDLDATQVVALLAEDVPPLAPPRSLAQVAADLAAQADAQGVAEVLLSFLAGPFVRCGLMRAEHDQLRGWHAFGPGLDTDRFAALTLTADSLSMPEPAEGARRPLQAGRVVVRDVAPEVAACWNGADPRDWIVAPIVLKGRVVSAVLGHRAGRPAPERLLLQLSDLTRKAGLALELCILRRKLVGTGSLASDLTPATGDH